MARNNPIYYIAPSGISVTPNANGSAQDFAVYVARGTKIKVHYPYIPDLDTEDASFIEWTLAGRNRSVQYANRPYTLYARLAKGDKTDAYLVFAAKIRDTETGEWHDPYVLSPNTSASLPSSTTDRNGKVHTWQPIPAAQAEEKRENYWWIKVGDVLLAENGQRTVDLDTGILGTDQYNAAFDVESGELPLRVELTCYIDNEDAGQTPFVRWDKTAVLSASLVEGWDTDSGSLVHHWTISRNTGDAVADAEWNFPASDSSSSEAEQSAERQMPSGRIQLAHMLDGTDDFAGASAVVFTVTAWGMEASSSSSSDSSSSESSSSSSSPEPQEEYSPVVLATGVMTMLADDIRPRDKTYNEWVRGGKYYYQTLNPVPAEDGKVYIETSYVWHKNCLWMCLRSLTSEEPGFRSEDWTCVRMEKVTLGFYTDTEPPLPLVMLSVRPQHIDETVKPYLLLGQEDISQEVTEWSWVRQTSYTELDEAWKNGARTDPEDPESPLKSQTRVLHITYDDNSETNDLPPGWNSNGGTAAFVCTASFPYGGGENAEIQNVINFA